MYQRPDLELLSKNKKLRPRVPSLEPLLALKEELLSKAKIGHKKSVTPTSIPSLDVSHPLSRNPRIVPAGSEADTIIKQTKIADMQAKLNFSHLKGRVPVIVMEAAPQSRKTLQHLTRLFNYKVGWKEGKKLGWAWVTESVLVVSPAKEGYVFHCLALSSKNFPEICVASEKLVKAAPVMLDSLQYVIGRSTASLMSGTKRRGGLKYSKGDQQGQEIHGLMCMSGWVRSPLCLKPGEGFTFSFYRLNPTASVEELEEVTVPHTVCMNALEALYCPGANNARWEETKHLGGISPGLGKLGAGTGITATQSYSCAWHLDSSTRGTFESILFGPPPKLPRGHRWVFGLIDAGVLLDLSAGSPLFLMLPGQDVLHATLNTGHASGKDHIDHEGLGSALMNKQKLTTELGKEYPYYDMIRNAS
jgi:hypothetical protein